MALFLVETVSVFRMRYVVEEDQASHAADAGQMMDEDLQELSQLHLSELITSTREIDVEEYLKIFDEDNDYLSSWDTSMKLALINT